MRQSLFFKADQQQQCALLARCCFVMLGFALPLSVAATNIFLLSSIILFLLSEQWRQNAGKIWQNPACAVAICVLFWIILSLFHHHVAWSERLTDLQKYAKLFCLFLFLPIITHEPIWQRRAVNAFLVAMGLTLICIWLKQFHLIKLGSPNRRDDIFELFRNHIQTSFLLAFALFIFLWRAIYYKHLRKFYLLLFSVGIISIFCLSLSRTGYVVVLALMALIIWQQFSWHGLVIAISAGIIAIGVINFLWPMVIEKPLADLHDELMHVSTYYPQGDSTELRAAYIHNTLELISQAPLRGTGLGSFKTRFYLNYGSVPLPGEEILRTPHNEWLMITTEMGLIGAMLWLLMFISLWKISAKLSPEWRALTQAFTVWYVIGFCCDTLFFAATTGFTFVYFASVIVAASLNRGEVSKILYTPSTTSAAASQV